MFELRTLVEAMEFGGKLRNQLNLSSLASFECLARRIAAIVDAFSAGSIQTSPRLGLQLASTPTIVVQRM